MAPHVTADQVISFRLRSHHLIDRAPLDDLPPVAGACGIQDSPPGSAALALNARTEITPAVLTDHLDRHTVVTTWAMRGAPLLVPVEDAAVFTTGVLPPTQAGRLHLIRGVEQSLTRLSMGLDEVTDLVRVEVSGVLTGRLLTVNELGEEVAPRVAARLPDATREVWDSEGPHAKGQPVGEAVVHFVLRLLTLEGLVCLAPSTGTASGRGGRFTLVQELTGGPFPPMDPEAARAKLLRRYLHCYGPSTRADFAAWLGVTATDARAWWDLLTADSGEGTEVTVDGRRAWCLSTDLPTLTADTDLPGTPGSPHVRFLPPHDPYVQGRDRTTLVEKSRHRDVWKTVGAPGTVLLDGRIAATWRPKTSGRTLTVTISPFTPLSDTARAAFRNEADRLGPFRGADRVSVVFPR